MQVSVENVGKLGRKLTVRLPADRLESSVASRIQEMGRTARLKGFRPGKVPSKVIEQRYGAQIRGEVLSDLIGSTFQEAVNQQKLRPAVQPNISTTGVPSGGELEYTAEFEVMPELGKIDVSQLEVAKPVAVVGDGDVDQMIETLRQQRRSWPAVERAAQEGDMVLFEYSATASDFRYPATGTDRVGTVIGSGALFKDLEDKLVGYKAGDRIEIDMAFPSDFRVAELAGKLARMDATIVRVQEGKLPDVDEAFAQSFGIEGGVDKFREDVKANLDRELKGALNARLKAAVVEKLVDAHADLEVPQGMVEQEARALAKQQNNGQGDPSQFEPFLAVARRRVAAGLLLSEIARQNELRLEPKRVSELLATIASTYEEPQKVVELYSRDPQMMNALQGRALEDQVVDWVAEHAKVSEQQLAFNEVMRPGV